jgi:hypothetical protein
LETTLSTTGTPTTSYRWYTTHFIFYNTSLFYFSILSFLWISLDETANLQNVYTLIITFY